MRIIIQFSLVLTIIVIALGAYTRLSDAGLGCPDWPGCYGQSIPTSAEHITYGGQLYTVDAKKAWIEMIHRYSAACLGLCILMLLIVTIKQACMPLIKLSAALSVLIILQATLGMLTVTMKLQPIVVSLHLLGGFSTLALLFLCLKSISKPSMNDAYFSSQAIKFYRFSWCIFGIVVLQVLLGAWVSTNYAAPYCMGFPLCDSNEAYSFFSLFQLKLDDINYEYGIMNSQARMSIHLTHRIGALITTVSIVVFAIALLHRMQIKRLTHSVFILLMSLSVQVALGLSLIFFEFPMIVGVLHNLIAAMLIVALLNLMVELKWQTIGVTAHASQLKPALI